ncbi:MAG: ABC transporter substrate-binding protein [Phormidesmis sp.]
MKRRWFLTGLALSTIGAGCKTTQQGLDEGKVPADAEGVAGNRATSPTQDRTKLIAATSANYPPYEYLETDNNSSLAGFDIDLAGLIAQQLGRELEMVNLAFDKLIPALISSEADMAIAALEPNDLRQQSVDFSDVYYRSRQALISAAGYLRPFDLNYQTIGIREGSVQARYTEGLSAEYPDLNIVTYGSIDDAFEALDAGAIEGILLEATVAEGYLRQYSRFEAQIMPSDQPNGSAIALPKNSSLRGNINAALADIKASGEMDRLIKKWFS